uniref:Uncharacterized protein n=1 Tax=uncultured prokaryote TaxID=198431 RepID=A0A0H5Q1Q4_9ZZZZ|nr:hypothetical protein [uncultured prokaryote]
MRKFLPILLAVLGVVVFAGDTSAFSQHILFRDSANGNTVVDGQTQYENYFGTSSADYNFYNDQVKSVFDLENDTYICESYKRAIGYATRICVADGFTFTYLDFFGGIEKPANDSFVLPKGDYTIEVSQQNQFFDWTTNNNEKYFFNILKGKNLANSEDLHAIESAGIISNGNYSIFEKITLQNYYCAETNCFFRFLFRVNEDKTIPASSTSVLNLTMNLTSFQEANNIYYLYNSFVSAVPFGNSVYNNTVTNNPLVELASYEYGSVPDTEPTNPDMTLGDINNSINDINNSLNNSDVSGAGDTAGGFFNNFTTDTHGLTAIITAPLNTIKSLLNTSCETLALPLPFVSKTIELPCMATVYGQFQPFYGLYQVITYGFIAYWVCVRLFNLVKDFKNPEHDEVEVMDL